jgi:hypothetical protein
MTTQTTQPTDPIVSFESADLLGWLAAGPLAFEALVSRRKASYRSGWEDWCTDQYAVESVLRDLWLLGRAWTFKDRRFQITPTGREQHEREAR